MASLGSARKLRLRLTLEGIEVPVVGASVRSTVGGPAAAQIQIVPTDRGMELLPRTKVHLFYREDALLGFESRTDEGTQHADTPTVASKAYRTAFVGQLVGFHFAKSPGGRSLVLQCLDDSTEWDTVYQYMYDPNAIGSAAAQEAATAGAQTQVFDSMGVGGGVFSRVAELLEQSPKTAGLTHLKGLLGGLISVLEACGGVPGQTRGVNDFTTIAELMSKTLYQVMADEADDTPVRLFKEGVLSDWLLSQLQQLGGRITLRDVIRLINSRLYYDIAPNPFPYYGVGSTIAYGTGDGELRAPLDGYQVGSEFGMRKHPILRNDDGTPKEKMHYGVDIGAPEGTPIFPIADGEVIQVQVENAVAGNAIRLQHADGLQSRYLHMKEPTTWQVGDTVTVDDVLGEVGSTGRSTSPHLHLETKRNGVLVNPRDVVDFSASEPRTPRELTEEDRRRSARLGTLIFRPDVWFVAPPMCNVFFPEHYSNFSYGRTFLKETTRAHLQAYDSMLTNREDGILASFIMAPYTREMQSLLENGGLEDGKILVHEKFSGVVPDFSWVDQEDFFVVEGADVETPSGLIKEKGDLYRYIANFNFFKTRFQGRTLSVSGGPFNPFPVAGFPGLIINRGLPSIPGRPTSELLDLINSKDPEVDQGFSVGAGRVYMPTQYLGMVTSLNHSITQDGGTTSATLNHARVHRAAGGGAEDEFLDSIIKSEGAATDGVLASSFYRAADSLRARDFETLEIIAAATPQNYVSEDFSGGTAVVRPPPTRFGGGTLSVGDPGPLGGTIESIETSGNYVRPDIDITSRGSASPNPESSQGVLRAGLERALPGQGLNDDERAAAVLRETNLYGEVRIVERLPASAEQAEELGLLETKAPAESILFPPWISSNYYNENIGDRVYRPFFGTGAIIDPQSVRERRGSIPASGSATPSADARVSANETILGGIDTTANVTDLSGERLAQAAEEERVNRELQDEQRFLDETTAQQSLNVEDGDPTLEDYLSASSDLRGFQVEQTISIAQATDALSVIYGHLKSSLGLDINRFVRRYTYRPIATMEEVLGSAGFSFDDDGQPVRDFNGDVQGFEGFHSRAVAALGDLKALVEDPDLELPSVAGEDPRTIDRRMDPRLERQARVQRYVQELLGLRGLASRGLPG